LKLENKKQRLSPELGWSSVENLFLKERAAVKKNYQTKDRKSNHKFEVVGGQELMVRVPLPMAEVWAEMQAQVAELNRASRIADPTNHSENEVTRRESQQSLKLGHPLAPLAAAM
jgi:hypothetical protein